MPADKLLDVAARSHADAVHPGYGFLSEIPGFAQAVLDAGIAWIGPSPQVLDALGDKIKARRLAESVDVAPVAGPGLLLGPRAGQGRALGGQRTFQVGDGVV